jgi:hypothetical protein
MARECLKCNQEMTHQESEPDVGCAAKAVMKLLCVEKCWVCESCNFVVPDWDDYIEDDL